MNHARPWRPSFIKLSEMDTTIVYLLLCSLVLLTHIILIVFRRKTHFWLPSYLIRELCLFIRKKPKGPIHIIIGVFDHFEVGNGGADLDEQTARIEKWCQKYPMLASKHKDSDSVCPQHTFFYPPHYDSHNHLERIVALCSRGFGEVEMHLHHDRQEPWPDDVASLRKKITRCIEDFSRNGIFCLPDGRKTYGFIHGDWALCNSLKGGAHCGINDELSILLETGCYADFTFPVCSEAQPKLSNTIFYAESTPYRPKGYDKFCTPVKKGRIVERGLMLIQGIIGLRWKSRVHRFKPSIEQSNISRTDLPFRKRIDYWIKKGVCIEGKPDWIFIKLHCHGGGSDEKDRDILLGKECDDMFTYLEAYYNDGKNYILHYVTARQMYNIIKAAEKGLSGNPGDFRDFAIPKYVYLN